MPEPVDLRVIKLVQALDDERRARIKFERLAGTLRSTIARMQKQRTTDAEPKPAKPEQRPTC